MNKKAYAFFLKKNRPRNKVSQPLNYFTVEENNNTNKNNEIKRRNRKRKMFNV